jgi:putative transposase
LSPADVEAASQRFKKALIERALGAELSHHLGYPPGAAKPDTAINHRNGTSENTVLTDEGPLPIAVPRDRHGTFEPQLIPKHERRFTGFDDKIIALYARGLTVREIQKFLAEMYTVEVSPDLISTVTDAVVAEVSAWQTRPLESMYPVVFFDALRVKIRDEGIVQSKAVYLALGVQRDGTREILGLWIEQTEGAKFWMRVFADLKARGCDDILIAVTDGLSGMPAALEAVYPATTLQTCIVHLIRRSLDYASWKHRKALAGALRPIYTAPSAEGYALGGVRRQPSRPPVSDGGGRVASRMAAGDPLLCFPSRGPSCDLHDQCLRERECPASQNHQNPWPFPDG